MDDTPPLEVVFSFNTAGAYGALCPDSRKYLKDLIRCMDSQLLRHLLSLNSSSKTRFAIFAHGDASGNLSAKNYGIKWIDFTDDVTELTQFVDSASPLRWGSVYHCYELVLRKAGSLSWTPRSRRALVLVGCTRTHYGMHPGSGELIHAHVEARCLAQMDVKIFALEVKIRQWEHEFYRQSAEITEGCHMILEQFPEMRDVITAIVSHLVGPQCLEEFEQEMLCRPDDCLTSDMVRVFASLRQHEDVMRPLYDATGPPTPPGGDFDDDDDFDVDDVTSPSEKSVEEAASILKRRSSLRLKQKNVSFYVSVRGVQKSAQKPVTSSTSANNVTAQATRSPTLRKSQTLPLPTRRGKESGRVTKSLKESVVCAGTSEGKRRSNPRKKSALRRGATSACLGQGNASDDEELGFGEPLNEKIYKVDPEALLKRENVSPRAFTLKHLSWSPWTLVISLTCPAQNQSQWEPRSKNGLGGFRKKQLMLGGEDDAPGLYELALKPERKRKCVVFYAFLSKLHDTSSWENQILGKNDTQEEVSEAVRKNCSVFMRRATFSQASRVKAVVQTALHRYDYAWNDVQGLKRKTRRVDFL
ncbi:uncharacterized protein [Littorina saxatilis]